MVVTAAARVASAAAVGTVLAAETFREAPGVGGRAAARLAVAGPLAAALPGPVVHEVLPAWVAAASVVVAVGGGGGFGGGGGGGGGEAAAVAAAAAAAEVVGSGRNRRNVGGKENESKTEQLIRVEDSLARLRDCSVLRSRVSRVRGGSDESNSGRLQPVKQKKFATSKEAADALIKAAEQFDVPALQAILGPGGADLVVTADEVQDKERAATFAAKAAEKTTVTPDPKNPSRAILSVGNEEWPYPVPIVKGRGGWFFDALAGRKEILARRIGANELDALTICRGYAEVQKEYALQAHDGVNQYAQRIISTPGKRDGLAWKNEDGTWGGPIGEGIAKALQQGYTSRTEPYHGYYFKILKGQGPAAPLGKMDFMVKGVMIGGFALVAVPAEYRVTGVKTFIVSYEDIVYEKDLGPNSLKIVKKMELYNPDKTWRPTDASW